MKIAIVIPWFGRELKGGAEQHAWQIAARLAQRGHTIEVLTTCCRSHQDDWETNHLPHGFFSEPEGFNIRRFQVDARDRAEFDRVNALLLGLDPSTLRAGVSPISAPDSRIFATELIKSKALLEFLQLKKAHFDSFIFLPYLYSLILEGIQIVGARAALQPCLHDEAYAYLPEVAAAFYTAGKLLFISEGEQELAWRLFGPALWQKSALTGAGVEIEAAPRSTASSRPAGDERHLLYLGRKDPGKNVPLLLKSFARFRAVRPNSKLRLLLAGHGSVDLNGCGSAAQDLGLISESEKQRLLSECAALLQPSQNESFSRVMMEAWLNGKPVAVHSRCLATAVAVQRAEGGWLAESETDWAKLFVELDRLPESELSRLGANGRNYAEGAANWSKVIDRYELALKEHETTSNPSRLTSNGKIAINQFLPNLAYGDAISNQAIFIRDHLRERGFHSDIYVRFVDPRVAGECLLFSPAAVMDSSVIIYHHSIGSEITPHVLRFPGPKCLIYHNITPAEFFEPFRPDFAAILRRGREQLSELASHFPMALGVSAFNATELSECGFPHPEVLPICVDPAKWTVSPDPVLMRELQDGRTNLLFVGRISPNKKQDDLLLAFQHYLELDPTARLTLVGTLEKTDPYVAKVLETHRVLHLEESMQFTGNISEAQLSAYYRTAHLFWSMSEHEGFCVPLIEAMWFDVPILAFRSSAIPETLGMAALMFQDKANLPELAACAHLLVTDRGLRQTMINAQRQQRATFLPARIEPLLDQLTERLLQLQPVGQTA